MRMQFHLNPKGVALAAAVAVGLFWGGVARAGLVLTPAGRSEGFSLATFATGFPVIDTIGPLGIAFPTTGGVLVTDSSGNARLFPTDANGQLAGSAPVGQNYGSFNGQGLAQVGGNIYMTRPGIGEVVQINNNGSFHQLILGGITGSDGIVTNPANGHLFVSTVGNNNIFDVDPVLKTATLFAHQSWDGVSTDGKVLYGAADAGSLAGHIIGIDIATKQVVFDSGFIPGGVDGTALGNGVLDGNIFVNLNNGTVVEVDLATKLQTLIATGGSRGDFVTVDPNDGSLLLTQTDRIIRLIPPEGGGFGSSLVPEPASIVLLGAGLAGLMGCAWWSNKRSRVMKGCTRIFALLGPLLLHGTARADLIVNGSFESPSASSSGNIIEIFPGREPAGFQWTVNAGTVEVTRQGYRDPADQVFAGPAYDGLQWLDLDGISAGSISQRFATTPGHSYTLTFA